MDFLSAGADILLCAGCPGCGLPGRGVCGRCASAIMGEKPAPRCRAGVTLPLWAANTYLNPVRRVISQAKDHHHWDALGLLSARLAFAVAGLADQTRLAHPGLLVAIPSTPRAVRERGLDFTGRVARGAAIHLARIGLRASVCKGLRHTRTVQDQGGLSAPLRVKNMAGSLAGCPLPNAAWVVVIDDVVTTGASIREGIRALTASGAPIIGAAVIAATMDR